MPRLSRVAALPAHARAPVRVEAAAAALQVVLAGTARGPALHALSRDATRVLRTLSRRTCATGLPQHVRRALAGRAPAIAALRSVPAGVPQGHPVRAAKAIAVSRTLLVRALELRLLLRIDG